MALLNDVVRRSVGWVSAPAYSLEGRAGTNYGQTSAMHCFGGSSAQLIIGKEIFIERMIVEGIESRVEI